VTPRPGEPDRLAGGGEPARPAQPARHRQRGDRPDPVQPRGQHLRGGQVPGGVEQLVPQHMQPGLQGGDHLQGGGDLQLPGRGQAGGRGRPQRGQALPGAQHTLAQGRGALVEEHRVNTLHPGGVLGPQVVIGLQQGPAFQDVTRRDPALRQPALGQQHPQVPAVGLVGLGVPLAAAGEGGISRLGQMRAADANEPARPGATLRYLPSLPPAYPIRRSGASPGRFS
jgi:hypothetical protein